MLESYKPPTDVLYKFMAIAGLVIVLAASWRYTTLELDEHRLQMLVKAQIHDDVFALGKLVVQDFEEAESQLKSERTEPTREAVLERVDQISKAKGQIEKLNNDAVDRLSNELRAIRIDKEAEGYILTRGYMFGAALTLIGFFLWYIKVQRPLDIILQAQAAEAIRKIKAG